MHLISSANPPQPPHVAHTFTINTPLSRYCLRLSLWSSSSRAKRIGSMSNNFIVIPGKRVQRVWDCHNWWSFLHFLLLNLHQIYLLGDDGSSKRMANKLLLLLLVVQFKDGERQPQSMGHYFWTFGCLSSGGVSWWQRVAVQLLITEFYVTFICLLHKTHPFWAEKRQIGGEILAQLTNTLAQRISVKLNPKQWFLDLIE